MHKKISSFIFAISLLLPPGFALAETVVDQKQTKINVWQNLESFSERAQTITVGKAGELTKVELPNIYLNQYASDPEFCTDKIQLKILKTVDGIPQDEILAVAAPNETVPTSSNKGILFDYTGSGLEYEVSDLLAISISISSPNCDFRWSSYRSDLTGIDVYDGGNSYFGYYPTYAGEWRYSSQPTLDMTFRTYVTPLTWEDYIKKVEVLIHGLGLSKGELNELKAKLKAIVLSIENNASDRGIEQLINNLIATIEVDIKTGTTPREEGQELVSLLESILQVLAVT